MAIYKWIKIIGKNRGPVSTGSPDGSVDVGEFEIINAAGNKVSVGGTVSADSSYSSDERVENTVDGNVSTAWQSAYFPIGTIAWLAYYVANGMDAHAVRLYGRPGYAAFWFVDACVFGSNNSTNGVDGTWNLLADGVNMVSGWSEHLLSGGVEAASSRPPLPAVLGGSPCVGQKGWRL